MRRQRRRPGWRGFEIRPRHTWRRPIVTGRRRRSTSLRPMPSQSAGQGAGEQFELDSGRSAAGASGAWCQNRHTRQHRGSRGVAADACNSAAAAAASSTSSVAAPLEEAAVSLNAPSPPQQVPPAALISDGTGAPAKPTGSELPLSEAAVTADETVAAGASQKRAADGSVATPRADLSSLLLTAEQRGCCVSARAACHERRSRRRYGDPTTQKIRRRRRR